VAFRDWPNFDLKCSPLEHWRWKYKDNPQNRIVVCLAENYGKIIGCHHTIPARIKLKNCSINAHQSSDLAVHPDYRRQGIAGSLGETINKLIENAGIKFKINFELNPSVLRSNKRSQYEDFPHRVTIFVRIKDIDLFLKSNKTKRGSLGKYGYKILKFLNKLRNPLMKTNSETESIDQLTYPEITISDVERFDNRVSKFWKKIRNNYDLIIERDMKYLNWRYCDFRGGDYNVKIAETKGEILGYIVLRNKKEKSNSNDSIGYIVDLLALPERSDVADKLLSKGIDFLDESSANIIQSFMTRNHPLEKVFRKQGFLNSRIEVFVLIKSGHEEKTFDRASVSGRLHIQYGDTDWI